jgi:aryl-alcohol dehydrogenase-like predicted oxidoreductase
MQYTSFGRTGISVSRLCLGTGTFGKQADEAESFRMFDRVADAGVNFIDTADIYPGGAEPHEAGRSEEITGRWLQGKRGRFILASKAGGSMGPDTWDQGSSRKHLLDAIDASLKRLNTDYIDLYQLHMDDAVTPIDETIEALDLIVRSGKARYIGVSNFLAYRLARALGRQEALRLARFVSVQPRYNLLFREIERELLPLAREEQIAVNPYNPLAGGLLAKSYALSDAPDKGRFSAELGGFAALYHARYWHQRQFDTVAALQAVAADAGVPLATLSVAWILANPIVTSAILGASRTEQLVDTLAAADYVVAPDVKMKLDEITHEYRFGDATR